MDSLAVDRRGCGTGASLVPRIAVLYGRHDGDPGQRIDSCGGVLDESDLDVDALLVRLGIQAVRHVPGRISRGELVAAHCGGLCFVWFWT